VAASDADDWKLEPIRLRYRLGSITLFRLPLSFAVYERHFTRIEGDAAALRPPFERWGRDVKGALVMSHPLTAPLPRVQLVGDAIRYVPGRIVRHYLDLSGTFDAYLAKFSSKTRSTLKKKVRRFAERSGGTIDWREYRTAAEARQFHQLARVVAEKTYQEHLLDAALPADEAFVRGLEAEFAAGGGRGWILFLDGAPVAYLYSPIVDGAVIYEHLGYDPAHRELSAGTVLQYLVLERLFAEGGFSVFDFTEGGGQHKEMFATGKVEVADLYFFRRGLASAGIVGAHVAAAALTRTAIAALDRLQARDKLRRWLRRGRLGGAAARD
jgi:CelD/BcsL family acetyltransferase involved in cellulose biosynthesis